jgi:hypothetical protein
MNRYRGRTIALNDDPMYKSLFEARGVKSIRQYRTAILKYPKTEDILSDITEVAEIWGIGSALWKLSEKYYADPELWFLIAAYNRKIFFSPGEQVIIPLPLEKIIKLFEI